MSVDDIFPGLSLLESVRKRRAGGSKPTLQAKGTARLRQPVVRRAARTRGDGTGTSIDEEPRRKHPVRAASGPRAPATRLSKSRKAATSPVRPTLPTPPTGPGPARPVMPRAATRPSGVAFGLATGSQSAVVKLASYASGGSRVGALMAYQSREGELALEHSDGRQIVGNEAIRDLAETWATDAPERQPSSDVLRFRMRMDGTAEDAAIRDALDASLARHRFAWRAEQDGEGRVVHVVASAASSARDEAGKAVRIYDTAKSLDALEQRLAEGFGPEFQFEAQGFAHGVEGVARFLSHLTKRGELPAVTETGGVLSGHEANLEAARGWKRDLRSRETRDVAHIIISAKPGTDRTAFVGAARAMLEREFAERDFVFALHENRAHLHVHAVVKMAGSFGQRMHPNIGDFRRWRQTMAEEARERHIAMEAPRRFEQANPPGYTLKDIRRVERGEASTATRQRVEAVRRGAVHVPTRPEGRERAQAVARQWRLLGEHRIVEPALGMGMTRFYRTERIDPSKAAAAGTPLFTSDRDLAVSMLARGRRLVYVDVPSDHMSEVKAARRDPERLVVLSPALADRRQVLPMGGEVPRRLDELRSRTETAIMRQAERHRGSQAAQPEARSADQPQAAPAETSEGERPASQRPRM